MKRLISLMLAALMLFACMSAIAEGTMYNGDITFLDVPFGALQPEVVGAFETKHPGAMNISIPMSGIPMRDRLEEKESNYGLRPFPVQGDAYNVYYTAYGATNEVYNQVAGYDVSRTEIYCVYPVVDGALLQDGTQARFAAAMYTYDSDTGVSDAMYDDLLSKLTGIYGEPYSTGYDLNAIWGEPDRSQAIAYFGIEDTAEAYAEMRQLMGINDHFTVWKSATNGAFLVLERDSDGDTLNAVKIAYFCPEGDQWLAETFSPGTAADTTSSTDGL